MKRRNTMIGGGLLLAAPAILRTRSAWADGTPDASRLNGDLTPLGGERAASKSGLVPAWTGGAASPPGWSQGMPAPNLFPNQQPLFTVTAANIDQYSAMLSSGQKLLIQRLGYQIPVYPSARTACAPQYVYDNTMKNVGRAQAAPEGISRGIVGCINGAPFPILSSDPSLAGIQAVWNHLTRYTGHYYYYVFNQFVVGNGQRSLTDSNKVWRRMNYYNPDFTPEDLTGNYTETYLEFIAPPNAIGGKDFTGSTLRPTVRPDAAFEYLVGEGRIREAPQAQYDIPATQFGDAINYDQVELFYGAPDRYDWKVAGKKEMIVPYNQYDMYNTSTIEEVLGLQLINHVRYEVHRVWVVEGTVKPGVRMTNPFRRLYLDEDTWAALTSDLYDDQNNYQSYGENYVTFQPALPATITAGDAWYNFQKSEYSGAFLFLGISDLLKSQPIDFSPVDASKFEPQAMANSGGL